MSQFIEMFGGCANRIKLSSLCSTFVDGDWIESKDQSELGVRLIQTGNVGNGFFKDKEDKSRYISEETFDNLHCTEIYPGDILVSRLPDPIGRACIIPQGIGRTITAVDCTIIRLKDIILPDYFIAYTMTPSYAAQINEVTTGTTRRRVSRANLGNILIPCPSIAKQQQFVAIAKQADKSKFGGFKSQFIEMFGNPLSPIQKWPIVRLGDYCIVNPTKPKGISDEMEVSFIPMQDVSDDGSCNKFINRPYAEVKKGFTYCADGDVIFAKITPCMENGKGAELQGLTNAMGMGSTEFHVLRPISGKSISTWLYYFTKLDIIRKDAAKNMTGTGGQKRVPASYFDNFKIGVPSIDEQMNFAALANQADKSKSYVRIALKNLKSMLGYSIRQVV